MNLRKEIRLIVFFLSFSVFAQQFKRDIIKETEKLEKDSLEIYRPSAKDYLYRKGGCTPKVFDSELSLEKYYQHNFLRKDYFGLIPFPNIGAPMNPLVYRPISRFLPDIGFSAKQYALIKTNEVHYFDVKTPLSEIFYENGVNQGQMLQAFFTQSPHKRMNYSLQYGSLRSLGYYQRELSVGHICLATFNYRTPEERYKLWGHFLYQDINNQENGGIKNVSEFVSKQTELKKKKNIAVNLLTADSKFKVKRYYLKQLLDLFPLDKKGLAHHTFFLSHELRHETKNYQYQEKEPKKISSSKIYEGKQSVDKSNYERISNELTLALREKRWHLKSGFRYDRLTYQILGLEKGYYPLKIQTDILSLVANLQYHKSGKWTLRADGRYALSGKFKNDFLLNLRAEIPILKNIKCKLRSSINSTHPDFNRIIYKNLYKDYNYSISNFKATNSYSFHLYLLSKKYLNLYFNLYNVDRYIYFNSKGRVSQYDQRLKIFDIQTQSIIKLGKFGLENHLQYQHVIKGSEVLLIPDFIARASLYYEDTFFDKSLFLQTGFTLSYFSKFRSRVFFPVFNEFVLHPLEEDQIIGGYPFLDYFLNFKVFRMKFYIRAQHLNMCLKNGNYFIAPHYPATDFTLRIGLLWNLFT